MNSREIELLKLSFDKNEHQQSFGLSKYEETWYVDFWKIRDYTDHKWNILIEDIKYDLERTKKQYCEALKKSEGYNFAQKEFKKEIKDKYNHYNSKLKEATKTKLDRRDRTEYVIKLESKVELLKELMKICG